MPGPLRRKYINSDGLAEAPSSWRRFHLPDLPAGVSVVAIPALGVTWYMRGASYWRARIVQTILAALMAFAILALYGILLWGEHRQNGYTTGLWITAGILATLVVLGAVNIVYGMEALPFGPMSRSPNAFVRTIGGLLRLVSMLLLWFCSPGAWIVFVVDQLRPTPSAEWVARWDLERQLGGRKPGHHNPAGRKSR